VQFSQLVDQRLSLRGLRQAMMGRDNLRLPGVGSLLDRKPQRRGFDATGFP